MTNDMILKIDVSRFNCTILKFLDVSRFKYMILKIDVSRFKCTGRNSLGISEKTITVHITGKAVVSLILKF